MKRILLLITCTIILAETQAQYYYSDIIGTQLTNHQYKLIKDNQLKKITATSYEGNQPSTDFMLEQTITNNGQILTRSASSGNAESFFRSVYSNDKVVKTVDSSNSAINTVVYQYLGDKLTAVNSTNKDFDGTFSSTEDHAWFHNSKGQPERMLKVKNKFDTTLVVFIYDEAGNIAEEIWKKKNRITETYYYYYNSKNQLTDIVRYSRKARQMLPDYIFEYDENGKVNQMTQAQTNSANYLIWKYLYNARGLKEKELAYNKNKEFLGRVEYSYQ